MSTIRRVVAWARRIAAQRVQLSRSSLSSKHLIGTAIGALAGAILGFGGVAAAQQAAQQAPQQASSQTTQQASSQTTTQQASPLLAQQTTPSTGTQQAPSTGQPAQLQEVEVTGSRIKRTTDFSTPTPTTVIDSGTMESLGIVNVGQALSDIPSNTSTFTPTAAPNSPFYAGEYVADLRGLNGFFNSRTLVLLDGNRAVPTDTSDHFDLNFIPQVLVQRIDTVTGGASAAYGSGAVAGVINVILNRTLEGGKLDADFYDTHYNDARSNHVAFAYGHGLFDDRFHFVLGAEYQKSDGALCMQSGRSWCAANFGPYDTAADGLSPLTFAGLPVLGANVRNDFVSQTGAIAPPEFDFATFGYIANPALANYQATADGLAIMPYASNGGLNQGAAPGGEGTPVNEYDQLSFPTTRGLVTLLTTTKITDNINATLDVNWGIVNANNPELDNSTSGGIGLDNPFLPTGATGLPDADIFGLYYSKDWFSQIPNYEINNTSMKRVVLGFNGQIGDSSWSWDAHYEDGVVLNTEGEPTDFHANESSMALDVVTNPTTGQPECRITAALAANPGNPVAALNAAYTSATGLSGGVPVGPSEYPGGDYPSYLTAFESLYTSGVNIIDPVTGLNWINQEALLGENCVPLNPFGTQQLTANAIDYSTGNLSLNLRQTQTDFAINASGTIWQGIGAGPWTMALGYEWRQEVVHNTWADCPASEAISNPSAYTLCLAETTDFTVQFGNAYAGQMNVNEGYLEFNLPFLKNAPGAQLLELDIAGRESEYDNETLYALTVPPGSSDTSTFPTWKASLLYDPIQGVRFRATESRDSRAPDPRDLYYSQVFVTGSLFGTCYSRTFATSEACNINLLGNINLRPETATTTTFGVVLTPPQLPGLQFSSDWYHIHLTNAIEGAGELEETRCALGTGAAACPTITFNNYSYYNGGGADEGKPCTSGVSGVLYPFSTGVSCDGVPTLTGALAYQEGEAANIAQLNSYAYNGAFYDERGVDFSLNYVLALPDGSTLAARALTTFVDEQVYQNYEGGPIIDLDGQTGNNSSFIGLGDYQTEPRWRGNVSVTWAKGPFSLTPNMTWIGQGSLNNQGLACTMAELSTPSNPCDWAWNGFAVASGLSTKQLATEKYMDSLGYALLPMGVANHVPAYFLFGLNATYNFNVLKGLQIFGQVNNLLNKKPPFTASSGSSGGFNTTAYASNPVFYDELGMAYRVGFRLSF